MAPKRLSPIQPTQIQKRTPSGSFSSGGSTCGWAVVSGAPKSSLTTNPRIDDVDDEVKDEVNEHDGHGHHKNYSLDQQVVAGVDRGDEFVAQTRDGEQVLDHEERGQQTTDTDAGAAEQGDRGRAKGVAPHDPTPAQSLRAGHGDELFLHGGDEIAAQDAKIEREATDRNRDRRQRQTFEVGQPVCRQGHVGRRSGIGDADLDGYEQHEQHDEDEGGDGEQGEAARAQQSVDGPVGLARRDHGQGDGDEQGEDLAQDDQLDVDGQGSANGRDDRDPRDERRAQIAVQHVAPPDEVLLDNGPVESQLFV